MTVSDHGSTQLIELTRPDGAVCRRPASVQMDTVEVHRRALSQTQPQPDEPLARPAVVTTAEPAVAAAERNAIHGNDSAGLDIGEHGQARSAVPAQHEQLAQQPRARTVSPRPHAMIDGLDQQFVEGEVFLHENDVVAVQVTADAGDTNGGVVTCNPRGQAVNVVGQHGELVFGSRGRAKRGLRPAVVRRCTLLIE